MLLFFVVIIGIFVFAAMTSTSSSSTPSPSPAQPPQANVVKKTVPPIGKELSWNSNADICFALGSFMAGLNASGWIGAYENGTLGFDIRNFSSTFDKIHDRVPSDIIDFLARNPSILKRKQLGDHVFLEIEFNRTFNIAQPRTAENIAKSAMSTLEIVKANLQEGANKTAEITGVKKQFSFRVEEPAYSSHKILWIDH